MEDKLQGNSFGLKPGMKLFVNVVDFETKGRQDWRKQSLWLVERKLWAVLSIPCLCFWALSKHCVYGLLNLFGLLTCHSCCWSAHRRRFCWLGDENICGKHPPCSSHSHQEGLKNQHNKHTQKQQQSFNQQNNNKVSTNKTTTELDTVIVWWKRLTTQTTETEIYVTKIEGRQNKQNMNAVWSEAHEQLRKQIKQKDKIDVWSKQKENKKPLLSKFCFFFFFLPQIGKKQTNKEPITAPDFECQRLSKLPKVQELIGGFVDLFWRRKTPTRKHQTLCVVLQLRWVEEDSVSMSCDSIVILSIQLFVVFVDLRETRCSRNTLSLPTSWFRLWLFDRWNKIVGGRRWNLVIVAVVVHTFVMIVVVVFVDGVWLVLDGFCKGWRWREERQKVTVLLVARLVVVLLLLLRPMLPSELNCVCCCWNQCHCSSDWVVGVQNNTRWGKKQKFIGIVFIFSVFWTWWPVSILLPVSIIQSFNHSIIQ